MTTVTYSVPNISCGHCVHTIKMELNELQGVEKVIPDVESKSVQVTYQDPATEELIINLLHKINYPVEI